MRHNPDHGIMRFLMREDGVIAFRVAEALNRRHLNMIARCDVTGAVTAMADIGACGGKETFDTFDALDNGATDVVRAPNDKLQVAAPNRSRQKG
jgi:hypothetical protein